MFRPLWTAWLLVLTGPMWPTRVQAQCAGSIDLGNDTTLCEGQSLVLTAPGGYASYLWTGGSASSSLLVTEEGTYHCTVTDFETSGDLVVNGSFTAGAVGFTSDYIPGAGGPWGLVSWPGTYAVVTSPNLAHSNFPAYGDHTTGAGRMLVVNGAETAGQNVWCQTVNVEPGTAYAFSAWLSTCYSESPAHLQFTVNGTPIGELFAPWATGVWANFYDMWDSGTAEVATICITNLNTSSSGNDFALDDISFSPFCTYTDEIIVTYAPGPDPDLGDDTSVCNGQTITLDPAWTGGGNMLWSDGSTGPTFTTGTGGEVWVQVDVDGCVGSDTIQITVISEPVIDLGPDQNACTGETVLLDATFPGATYLWNNGSTSPTLPVTSTGTHAVTLDVQGCTYTDEVTITFFAMPEVDLGPDLSICGTDPVTLDPGWSGGGAYAWSNGSNGTTLTTGTSGTYWVTIDLGGCIGSDTAQVVITPVPVIELGPDQNACEGETLVLNAAYIGASHEWNTGHTGPTLSVTSSGTYSVELDLLGCTYSDAVTITFFPVPEVDLGPDHTICGGTTVTLDPAWAGGGAYLWSTGSTESTLTTGTSGPYWLQITENGCTDRDTVQVTVIPLPVIDLGNDRTACAGDGVLLDAFSPGATHLWSDGSTGATLMATTTGTYWVALDLLGCAYSDTVTITYFPRPVVELGPDTPICAATLLPLDVQRPGGTYLWNDGFTGGQRQVPGGFTYHVTVTMNGCATRDTIAIGLDPLPVVDLGPDPELCLGTSIMLIAGDSLYSYLWSTGDTLSQVTIDRAGTFTVDVSNACGTVRDEVTVTHTICDCPVYTPNSFTPDGDALNDGFRPVCDCELRFYALRVYDRWGRLVWETTDPATPWYGVDAVSGVFVWTLEYETMTQQDGLRQQLIGHVTVLR